ncbi:MAG TPA: hypothetical protein VGB17_16520 [Pyrinomonadaceae bacterium]|jgi:hypothetical protein
MAKRTLTPKAEPKQGELITLKEWKRVDETETALDDVPIPLPQGAENDDSFTATRLRGIRAWKTCKGDMAIALKTDDIQKGDYVNIVDERGPEPLSYMGFLLDCDECYYFVECNPACRTDKFHKAHYRITGRVVEIQRNGKPVQTALNLRPIHPTARIYQFKRRA